MGVLATYHGVLEQGGIVRLRQAPALPVGAEVVVAYPHPVPSPTSLPSLEEQERHLAALSPEEWRRPFDEFAAIVAQEQAEVDIASISDEELVALVHEARRERA